MKEIRKEIWNNGYLTLYSDGTMGISDGVGIVKGQPTNTCLTLPKSCAIIGGER